ncbi:hypothetical protein SAMN04490190_4119 [Pseudomonas libanensis]|uniref:Uncharacterized protein n=1 Tax=Pseudomonas libanensis TaxID=75588 RepID=A0A0R2YKC2_9PSED|nr:hypothetical protein [Pseudomonas libanensis]KRP47363.1 hypothetical protein TU73_06195 [Pseudomonas libanensis]SDL24849.1 hypothetical protein SAMN04490190_4119 [Pseudomonas libanensis]
MNYFKLNPNVTSKQWEGYVNLGGLVYKGEEIDDVELSNSRTPCAFEPLHYEILVDGKTAPVNTIGTDFFVFDEALQGLDNLLTEHVQFLPISHETQNVRYRLLHAYQYVDCVDWALSEYEAWPESHVVKEWQNPRGRFFFNPTLSREKIPKNTEVFRLEGWGGAFNIVICEAYKDKLLSLDFDHSFLEFHSIILV